MLVKLIKYLAGEICTKDSFAREIIEILKRNVFDNIVKMNDFSNRTLYKININLIKALGRTKETCFVIDR